MRVALYARVSSERQDVNLSISAQLRAMREYARKNGHVIVREFIDEAESGRCTNRPAFKEMISLARLKHPPLEAILVWKLSRFARNREDSIIYKSLLRKQGIQVISINEPFEDTPSGRLFEGIIEVMDDFYSSNLAQDVIRGMRENAVRGYFSGGKPPCGYTIVKTKDGGKLRSTLATDNVTAPIVKRIFEESASGKGLRGIAKGLNGDGYTTREGKKWRSTGIHALLTNEAYIGMLVWGKRSHNSPIRVENAWQAIVGQTTFNRVQSHLKARGPKIIHPRRTVSDYLLSGTIKCAVCGKAMSGHSAKSGQFFYYRCANALKGGAAECPSHWIPKSKIESFVIERIKNYILTEDNLIELMRLTNEELDDDMKNEREQIVILERQSRDVESRLEHLYNALETGSFSNDELAPRIRKWQARREELSRSRDETELALQLNVFGMPDIGIISEYVDDLKSLLGSTTVIERRAFLKSFVKEIQVGSEEMTVQYTLPMPPKQSDEEVIGVLPFIRHGRPCRSRTCDTLIKARTDIFHDLR